MATIIDELDANLTVENPAVDGASIAAGGRVATIRGDVRDLLTCERILLNFVGRLMGIATLTQQYVAKTAGTRCRVYDTRKTTPGWRRLEKYAVRCGGGHNHRTGLYDAILIKDNHLAQFAGRERIAGDGRRRGAAGPRSSCATVPGERSLADMIVEIEVDSLEQLAAVLPERPDIVLLDNMTRRGASRRGRDSRRVGAGRRAGSLGRRDARLVAGDRRDGRRSRQRRRPDAFGPGARRGSRLSRRDRGARRSPVG